LSCGGEVGGFEKEEEIKKIYLRHFRRLLGLSGIFNSLVLKSDLRLFPQRVKRRVTCSVSGLLSFLPFKAKKFAL